MGEPVVNLRELESRHVGVGHLNADWTFVGPAAGCVDVGMRRIQVAPGFFSTPLHVHADDEEIFFVLAGSGLSVQDDRTYAVRPGDRIVHRERGEAHTLKAGDDGLTFLAYGPKEPNDICYYPRSNKIAFRGVGVIGRIEQFDCWEARTNPR